METFNLSLFKPGIWSPNGITKSKHPLQRSTAKDCFLGKESMQQRGWVLGGHCHPLPQQPRAPQSGMVYPCIINFHHFSYVFHIFPIELDILIHFGGIHRYPSVSRHFQTRPTSRVQAIDEAMCEMVPSFLKLLQSPLTVLSLGQLDHHCCFCLWNPISVFGCFWKFLDVFGVFLEM